MPIAPAIQQAQRKRRIISRPTRLGVTRVEAATSLRAPRILVDLARPDNPVSSCIVWFIQRVVPLEYTFGPLEVGKQVRELIL
jgi:hypothetical protein